jgi:hypothetical protein
MASPHKLEILIFVIGVDMKVNMNSKPVACHNILEPVLGAAFWL